MTLIDLINSELDLNLPIKEQTISSPFRRDSNPSFRLYGVDGEGECRGAYDWGTGKSYNVVSFVMEYHNLPFKDALAYLETVHGYRYKNSEEFHKRNSRLDILKGLNPPENENEIKSVINLINDFYKEDNTRLRELERNAVFSWGHPYNYVHIPE